ncbi:hypothetical protein BH10PSE17_BH10PSE17_28580 [soil metagenome]
MDKPSNRLRQEIAAAAAQRIAEDGLDYATAKVKAVQQVLGFGHSGLDAMPDDHEVQLAVREYQRLFQSDTQPARLRALRELALDVMKRLDEFPLLLVGAVADGTATEHSEVYLQCYIDSSKDVHITLLNQGVDADADEIDNPFGRGRVERLSFLQGREAVHITCYPPNKARQIGDHVTTRLDRAALTALLEDGQGP